MSRATELSEQCGAVLDEDEGLFVMDEHELTAFYHAARAEALREAAAKWHKGDDANDLLDMADREGK